MFNLRLVDKREFDEQFKLRNIYIILVLGKDAIKETFSCAAASYYIKPKRRGANEKNKPIGLTSISFPVI